MMNPCTVALIYFGVLIVLVITKRENSLNNNTKCFPRRDIYNLERNPHSRLRMLTPGSTPGVRRAQIGIIGACRVYVGSRAARA